MPVLSGLTSGVQFVPGPAGVSPVNHAPGMGPTTSMPAVIDGTPVRVVVLALSAAAGLAALHMAGVRFSLGVSA